MHPDSQFRRAAILSALAAVYPAIAYGAGAARVDFASGSVTAQQGPGSTKRSLTKGAEVFPGDTVFTHDGIAQLRFSDGAQVSLKAGSEFRIDEYRFENKPGAEEKGFFSLIKGGLRTITGLVGRNNRAAYQMKTSVATIGIRGTEYSVTYGSSINVNTADGVVEVCNSQGCLLLFPGDEGYVKQDSTPPVLVQTGGEKPRKDEAPPRPSDIESPGNDRDASGKIDVLTGGSSGNLPPTGSVAVSGTASQNQSLTVSNTLSDPNGNGSISYQWNRNGTPIGGATSSSYSLTQADVGTSITVTANYVDGGGFFESITSSVTGPIANVNDLPTGSVAVLGSDPQGVVLTAGNTLADVDGLGTLNYQWRRNGVNIGGANSSTYSLTSTDAGESMSVQISYTDGQGTVESVTSPGFIEILKGNRNYMVAWGHTDVIASSLSALSTPGQAGNIDTSGVLQSFTGGGGAFTPAGSLAPATTQSLGNDGVAAWGTWVNTAADSMTLLGNPNREGYLHYVAGEPTLATDVTVPPSAVFSLLGGAVAGNVSGSGTVTSGSMNVNFGSNTVTSLSLGLSVGANTYTVSDSARLISTANNQLTFSTSFAGVTGTGCCTCASATVNGVFFGAGATRAGVSFNFFADLAGESLSGVAALKR